MLNGMIVIAAAGLLGALLYFERTGDHRRVLPVKTALSCLFVLVALLQPRFLQGYVALLVIGLVFCLGGDVFLALPQKNAFLAGLVSFLLGHVFYTIGFFQLADMSLWAWVGVGWCVILGTAIYRWLHPHLGTMRLPVLLYIVVISAMVVGAVAVLRTGALAFSGRLLVFSGAVCFYFSDIFVARDRFLDNRFLNRLIGLPLYYLGQFLLAFSAGIATP